MMRLIKEWMTIAESASRIIAKDPGNSAAEEIRQQAAEQLVLAGYPVDKDRNGKTSIETGDYRFVIGVSENSSSRTVRTLIAMDENTLDAKPATRPVPEKKVTTPVTAPETSPTAPLSVPQTKTSENSESAPKAPEIDENATRPLYVAAKVSADAGPKGYVDHMAKTDILFNYHNVRIRSADGIEMKVEVIVSPMSIEEGEKEILVWGSDGIKTEVTGPSGNMSTRLIRFGEVDLVVEGCMKDGIFESSVKPTKRMTDYGVTVSSEDEHMGGCGHIRLEDDGIEVRLVPTTTKNKRNGSAEFYYLIRQEGKEDILGENSTIDKVYFDFNGKRMELLARWNNDVLYSTVREA